jgi:hypothetical protein
MLDIDDAGLDGKLEQIEGIITKNMRGEKLGVNFKDVGKINIDGLECIYFYEADLIKKENEEKLGKFYLVLFNPDLEDVAEKWNLDEKLSEEEKIIKLAKDSEIQNKFYQFLK